ncbi:MAG: response regulator [Pseudohongiellaceae bacterium]
MALTGKPSDIDSNEAELRSRIVNSALRITAIAAPFISLLILASSFLNDELNLRTWLLCAYPLVFPVLVLLKDKLSIKQRGTVFLSLMMLMGFLVLFRGGISIAQAALQLWILLLAALLFGTRGVIITLAINLSGFAVAGYAIVNGLLPPFADSMWNPDYAAVWIRGGSILALFGGSSAIAVAIIINELERDKNQLRESLTREQSQRKALEDAKNENLQVQQALANAQRTEALGKMASGIAHDFNNALTIIMGSAEIAKLDSTNIPQVEKSLNAIVKASVNASELTRSLLSFGRKEPTQKSIVEVGELISNLEKPLRRLLPEDITLTVSHKDSTTVEIDKSGLEKSLFNLIANSKESIEGSGEIVLRSRSVLVSTDTPEIPAGHYAVITVADSGKGIESEVKNKIFEPYFSTKEAATGAGLGLALLQSLMAESEGHITLSSELGKGTEISMHIPIAAQPSESTAAATLQTVDSSATENALILLVEDNAEVLSTMSDTLTGAGYRIVRAQDGREATEQLKKNHFDLLCIDGVIPGTSSAKVIEAFRKNQPEHPVVVCSGYIEEELIIRGIETGELGYIRKPFRSQELLDTIKQQLASIELSAQPFQ